MIVRLLIMVMLEALLVERRRRRDDAHGTLLARRMDPLGDVTLTIIVAATIVLPLAWAAEIVRAGIR